MLIIT